MSQVEWKEYRLGDLVEIHRGASPRPIQNFLAGEGMPWVKIADATASDSRFIRNTKECIIEAGISKSVVVNPGDLIVSNSATPGLPKFMDIQACIHDGWLYFSNYQNVTKEFLYYKFIEIQRELNNQANGSVFQNLKTEIVKNFVVRIPPLAEQKRIAGILSSLDDKIELNNAINKTLEQQAQTLFKSWFIDYEPFSGTMPDSWREGTVADIIVSHDSKRIPLSGMQRDAMDKIYPYYGATSCMDYVDNYIFDGIYLLLGEDGTVIDSEGFPILQYVEGKFWVNNHAHILTGKNGFSVEMLYLFFSLTNVREIVTGAVQPKISQGRLNGLAAIIPDEKTAKTFDEIIQPIFAQIRTIRNETQRLTTLRDTLLTKLMSGELDEVSVS